MIIGQENRYPLEKVQEEAEKITEREHAFELLKKEKLHIEDGYDYESDDPPKILPTLFHGTSKWFEKDIKNNGLNPFTEEVELEKVFALNPDLKICLNRLRKEKKYLPRTDIREIEKRRRIYATYNYKYGLLYTPRGPEIIEDLFRQMQADYGDFLPPEDEIIKKLGEINSKEKKVLMSVLKPKPMMVRIKKVPLKLLDKEEFTDDLTVKFVSNKEARKKLKSDIKKAFEMRRLWDEEYIGGKDITLSLSNANFMWEYIQDVDNTIGIENTLLLTIPELTEAYLRSRTGRTELLFKTLPAEYLEFENVSLNH